MIDTSAGEPHANAALILLDALKIPAEVIVRLVDGRAQEALQAVPGGQDLRQRPFICNAAFAVDGDAFWHFDANHFGPGAARFQRLEQLGVPGDAGAATDQLDAGALVLSRLPRA